VPASPCKYIIETHGGSSASSPPLELKSWYEKARKTAGKRSSEASGRTGELVQRLSYGMRGIATIDIDSDPAASVREARCAMF
jgi:hypothetical protein